MYENKIVNNIVKLCFYFTAASPVILQLTPLLGVVMGMIASLVLVALAILLALRFRGNKKRHARMPSEDIKKSSGSIDSMEKNPDIIPLNNGKFTKICYTKFCSAD